MTNQQLHVFKHVQLHISFFRHHVSVTLVTIIRVSHNKITLNVRLTFNNRASYI